MFQSEAGKVLVEYLLSLQFSIYDEITTVDLHKYDALSHAENKGKLAIIEDIIGLPTFLKNNNIK